MKIKTFIKLLSVMILLVTPALVSCSLINPKPVEEEEVEVSPERPEPQETQESTEIEVDEGNEGSF